MTSLCNDDGEAKLPQLLERLRRLNEACVLEFKDKERGWFADRQDVFVRINNLYAEVQPAFYNMFNVLPGLAARYRRASINKGENNG
jgi:hypothetical protein